MESTIRAPAFSEGRTLRRVRGVREMPRCDVLGHLAGEKHHDRPRGCFGVVSAPRIREA